MATSDNLTSWKLGSVHEPQIHPSDVDVEAASAAGTVSEGGGGGTPVAVDCRVGSGLHALDPASTHEGGGADSPLIDAGEIGGRRAGSPAGHRFLSLGSSRRRWRGGGRGERSRRGVKGRTAAAATRRSGGARRRPEHHLAGCVAVVWEGR
jgi:hypothetical protein